MPCVKLTPSFVQHAACCDGARKRDFFDTRQRGFLLEVRRSGGKTFYQRYRDGRGRERQFKIGSAAILSLGQARRKAREVAAAALLGSDPQAERQERRAVPTLRQFIQDRYLPFAKSAKRSWKTDDAVLRVHILPALGRRALDEITETAIADLLKRLEERGYSVGTTNRVLVLLRYIYNLARKWGFSCGAQNPTSGLKTRPDVCRERFLSMEEAQRLLSALEIDENRVAASAITLLLLTGARRNEVTAAKWEYVDWANRTLLVPVAKSGRPRLIALNGAALELLRSMPRLPGNPYILPSPITGRPCPSLHFPWTRVRERAGLEDLRLHDLRHSFASFLVNKGVSLYVVQGLLGHTQPRMTQRYAHLAQTTLAEAADLLPGALGGASASIGAGLARVA
jgi:integrase